MPHNRLLFWIAVFETALFFLPSPVLWAQNAFHPPKIHVVIVVNNVDGNGYYAEAVENEVKRIITVYAGVMPDIFWEHCLRMTVLHSDPLLTKTVLTNQSMIDVQQPDAKIFFAESKQVNSFTEVTDHLESMNVCPKHDSIAVHYVGHGFTGTDSQRSDEDNLFWKFTKRNDSSYELEGKNIVYASTVKECLKRKNIRLGIIMSDCCSGIRKVTIPPHEGPVDAGAVGASVADRYIPQINPKILSLFFHHQGIVDFRACRPDMNISLYQINKPVRDVNGFQTTEREVGTVFSRSFSMKLPICDYPTNTWRSFFGEMNISARDFILHLDHITIHQNNQNRKYFMVDRYFHGVSYGTLMEDKLVADLYGYSMKEVVVASINGGVLVTNVLPNSSAARLGFRVGDIITAVDHRRVVDDKSFRTAIGCQALAGNIVLSLIRNGYSGNLHIGTFTPNFEKTRGENFFIQTDIANTQKGENYVHGIPQVNSVPSVRPAKPTSFRRGNGPFVPCWRRQRQ